MRVVVLLVFACVVAAIGGAARMPTPRVLADSHGVEVTSAADTGGSSGAVCPDETLCTLRRAIEVANEDVAPGVFTISFAASAFPADGTTTITVEGAPLPTVARDQVTIDASTAGVAVMGVPGGLTALINGLTVTGAGFTLVGVHIHSFTGSCLAVTGESPTLGGSSAGQGNVFGGCKAGVALSGSGAVIQGNTIGLTPAGAADQVESGMVIAAGGALVGGPATSPEAANRIGFADTAIFIGAGAGEAFTGVQVERNNIGTRPTGEPAPVGVGIVLAQPSSASAVLSNAIENAQTGVQVRADQGNVSTVRNRISGNTFDAIGGMAIDLGGDGLRNPNDPGDEDLGPNTFLNHPLIARATQTLLTGMACAGCAVEVYLAAHLPGGATDYGRVPIPGGSVTADVAGNFAVNNPAAAPGDWLVAIAIDPNGNTSEFGPPARVGAGAVLCGNVQLHAGWNHVAYFGSEPVALFGTFPADASGSVTAIYRRIDGTTDWERWFSTTAAGRTLSSVQPGEAYWFFATAPVTLPGGFSISFPVPVQLAAGQNDFVYLGASAHPLDALASLGIPFSDLYRYEASTATWLRFGDASVPGWAQDFTELEACASYHVRLSGPATLVPLQP